MALSLSDYFNNATLGIFKPKTATAQDSYNPPPMYPVPTPNPLSSSGSGYPTDTAYNTQGQTVGTSWDAGRNTDPTQSTKNTQIIRNTNTTNTTPQNLGSNTPQLPSDALYNALISKGYNPTDARNAANGPDASNLYREYLGGGNGGGDQTPPANPLLNKNYSTIDLKGASLSSPTTGGSGDVFSELFAAAQAGNQSAIDMINSQYGQNDQQLNDQLGMTDKYQQNDLNTLLSQFNSTNTDIAGQRTSANQTVETQTGRAADQARMTQKQNRNVLRALGILGSTYAAENLAAPINAFDKQKADIAQWGTSRLQELDNFYNQKKSEYDNLVNDVTTKYGDLRQKIMGDLRYNQQQKGDALRAATAGAQQNLANLNMQKANYEQQIQQQKQALTTQIASLMMTKTPTANMNDIMNTSIAYANKLSGTNPNQQVGVYQGVSKGSNGFDMANYVGWDKNAAYQDWLSKNRA